MSSKSTDASAGKTARKPAKYVTDEFRSRVGCEEELWHILGQARCRVGSLCVALCSVPYMPVGFLQEVLLDARC